MTRSGNQATTRFPRKCRSIDIRRLWNGCAVTASALDAFPIARAATPEGGLAKSNYGIIKCYGRNPRAKTKKGDVSYVKGKGIEYNGTKNGVMFFSVTCEFTICERFQIVFF